MHMFFAAMRFLKRSLFLRDGPQEFHHWKQPVGHAAGEQRCVDRIRRVRVAAVRRFQFCFTQTWGIAVFGLI